MSLSSRLRFATLEARRYVWGYVRAAGRWPTRDEWHYILIGRWRGF